MVKMSARYTGQLHCELIHKSSGKVIETDAPKDNQGRGECFSPTDLVGAALASCILTTLAIAANKDGISIDGATAQFEKEMSVQPRRIETLSIRLTLPNSIPENYRAKVEQIAHDCPVARSLSGDVKTPLAIEYK